MPTFYNFTENGLVYSFDDVFVPADLFREGTLWTWGQGGAGGATGQLGNATTNTVSTPVTTFAGGSNWKKLDCGNSHTAAIKTDGTLWVWGYDFGLGHAKLFNVSTPITTFAGGNNWKQVSGGDNHVAAIKTDGTLWIWGSSQYGKLGNATTTRRSTPVTTFAGGNDWKQVSCGDNHVAAIKTDGTLWIWGGRAQYGPLGNNQTNVVFVSTPVTTFAGGNNWKQVVCADEFTAAIKTDGTLWTWGSDRGLGHASNIDAYTPVTTFAGGNNWKQVSCGRGHTAAIKTDGTLWIWGSNQDGALGDGQTFYNIIQTPITTFAGGNNWKQVSAGNYYTAAIKTDGTLWTWGRGSNGRLGNAQTTNRFTPVTTFAGGTNWKQVSCGYNFIAAVTYDDPVI